MGLLDGLEACEGSFVVEVVEMVVSLADFGGEIDGVGVGGGIVGVREGWGCQQEGEEKEAEGFDAAFYGSSPEPVVFVIDELYLLMEMIRPDAVARYWTQATVNYTLWYRESPALLCFHLC